MNQTTPSIHQGDLTAFSINWELGQGHFPSSADFRIVDLEIERDSYRELSQQLLHALHKVIMERDMLRLQRRIDRQRVTQPRKRAA